MANRRMFSLKVVDTDEFLDMPQTTQNLYFHLALRADDDGFVGNTKKIMKICNCGADDMKVLITKKFVILFDNGVCVIRHWHTHNLIRQDRYIQTEYIQEKKMLGLKEGKYEIQAQNVIPDDNQRLPNGRLSIGKVRLGYISEHSSEAQPKELSETELDNQKEVSPLKVNKIRKKLNKKVKTSKESKPELDGQTTTGVGDIAVVPWDTHKKIWQYLNEFDENGVKLDTEGAQKFKILAYFAIIGKQKFENKEQWEEFVSRNIRVVTSLIKQKWTCKQIILTALMLEAKGLSWNLDTINKWVARLDSELTKQKPDENNKYEELLLELKNNINQLNNLYGKNI